jgi:hypothetical protein
MAHKRQEIRDAIAAILSAVPAGAGRVYTGRIRPVVTYPSYSLFLQRDGLADLPSFGKYSLREATFEIQAHVLHGSTMPDDIDILAVWAEKGIGADRTLGGKALHSRFMGIEKTVSGDMEKPAGLASLFFSVLYQEPRPVAVSPHLISCVITAGGSYTRADIILNVWSDIGKIRYSAWEIATGTRKGISSYAPASPGTSYANYIRCLSLTRGQQYRLDYWLDCIPDVTGYTEGWTATTAVWTQPQIEDINVYVPYP